MTYLGLLVMVGLISGTIAAILFQFWTIGGAVLGGLVGALVGYLLDRKHSGN